MKLRLNSAEGKTYHRIPALFTSPEPTLLDSLDPCLDKLSICFNLPIPTEPKESPELTDLDVAYTGLFINRIGGAPAPPYGAYLEVAAQLMGTSGSQVTESYRSEGLNLADSEEPAVFPDKFEIRRLQ